jgi:hypothetical protein
MWRRTIEDEIRGTGRSWNEVKRTAGDCNPWKLFMDALGVTALDDDDDDDDDYDDESTVTLEMLFCVNVRSVQSSKVISGEEKKLKRAHGLTSQFDSIRFDSIR